MVVILMGKNRTTSYSEIFLLLPITYSSQTHLTYSLLLFLPQMLTVVSINDRCRSHDKAVATDLVIIGKRK
jgi:hypothetical protein